MSASGCTNTFVLFIPFMAETPDTVHAREHLVHVLYDLTSGCRAREVHALILAAAEETSVDAMMY